MDRQIFAFLLGFAAWVSTGNLIDAAPLRFAFWNTFNNPDNETEDAYFTTIFSAMPAMDLWSVAETDTDSSVRMNVLLDSSSGQIWQSFTSSSVGGDRTGIFWNTSTLTLIGSGEFTQGLVHPTAWATFRPAGTFGEADFGYVATHLKSGSTSSDIATRGTEATQLVSSFATLNVSAILAAGDFNWLGSSEAAYQNFMTGSFSDVAASLGNWRGNPDFKHLHTQDPRLNLDDRFDMMLGNSAMSDGLGIDYVSGSFKVFGNDGSHTVGGALTANSEIDQATLDALLASSDHLPIYASFVVIPEPSSLLLIGFSASCLFCRKRERGTVLQCHSWI
jgi:hypothetical protein